MIRRAAEKIKELRREKHNYGVGKGRKVAHLWEEVQREKKDPMLKLRKSARNQTSDLACWDGGKSQHKVRRKRENQFQ